jgi:hypothetical protein
MGEYQRVKGNVTKPPKPQKTKQGVMGGDRAG